MKQTSICVIGGGKWGSNHVKTLLSMNVIVGCVDNDSKKLKKIQSLFPKVVCFASIDESFKENFEGYIVATPPASHTELAKQIIAHSKPLLVEKPLSLSVSESKEIKSYLTKYNGKLLVGHLMLFHPAIQKIKSMIDEDIIGKIQYIYSNRLNLGTIRSEENVFWSFAPHDLSIFQFFTNSFPSEVFSVGGDILQQKIHDTTITYLKYPNNVQGHIYVSWLHPFKEHRLVVIGSKGSIHFEDSTADKELFLFEKDSFNDQNPILLKNKLSQKIKYDSISPLENELKYFIKIINNDCDDNGNIDEGIDVVKILEMATLSLESN